MVERGKERSFGFLVDFETSLVRGEMFRREVSEYGYVHGNPEVSELLHALARHLHDHDLHPCRVHFSELLLYEKGIRHCHVIRVQFLCRADAEIRAGNEPGTVSARMKHRPDEVGGGSLALGAGDADDDHALGRVSVLAGCAPGLGALVFALEDLRSVFFDEADHIFICRLRAGCSGPRGGYWTRYREGSCR